MNVSDAIKNIGEITEKALEANENAITWDTEINIKKSIVNDLDLSTIFSNKEQLSNMYIYEMFNEKFNIPYDKQIEMVKTWINHLNSMTEIKVNIDLEDIK
jgi:hypothetical protein|tara:strand:- start:161 stop:463 length:303 start_codon:yes stop_codon:yes gene_type:complete